MARSTLPKIVESQIRDIRVIAREFGVARLDVFGSVCTPAFDETRSDIDFLAEYPPDYDFGPWLVRLQDFEARLSDLLQRDVDVVLVTALRNPWFKREADKTRTVIYDEDHLEEVA
jgi:predicted nucleotidyltransferase